MVYKPNRFIPYSGLSYSGSLPPVHQFLLTMSTGYRYLDEAASNMRYDYESNLPIRKRRHPVHHSAVGNPNVGLDFYSLEAFCVTGLKKLYCCIFTSLQYGKPAMSQCVKHLHALVLGTYESQFLPMTTPDCRLKTSEPSGKNLHPSGIFRAM